jgi:hypothetical protein
MNHNQEIDGRLNVTYQPAILCASRTKGESCCGEDWDHVEENRLGTISAEKETLKTTKVTCR